MNHDKSSFELLDELRTILEKVASAATEMEKENREIIVQYENKLCDHRRYKQEIVKRIDELTNENERLKEALKRTEIKKIELKISDHFISIVRI